MTRPRSRTSPTFCWRSQWPPPHPIARCSPPDHGGREDPFDTNAIGHMKAHGARPAVSIGTLTEKTLLSVHHDLATTRLQHAREENRVSLVIPDIALTASHSVSLHDVTRKTLGHPCHVKVGKESNVVQSKPMGGR